MNNKETHFNWMIRLGKVLSLKLKSREQLLDLLQDAEKRNLLDAPSLKMIEGVLLISEQHVRDIMIPRTEMVILEQNQTLEEILPIIIESAHSRFPVTGETRDDVAGLLLAKDLLLFQSNKNITFNIKSLLRPAITVPESKRLDVLLHEFRSKHTHMAIVLDEYGNVSGLITIEDILEEIVGDIEDEYDIDEKNNITPKGTHHFIIKSLTPIEEVNHYFNLNLDNSEIDTIGGIVMRTFGRMPKKGESIIIENIKFKILQADSRRIYLLRATQLRSNSHDN